MGKKRRVSGLKNILNAVKRVLKKDEKIDGVEYKAGQTLYKGARCPNKDCGKFYPGVSTVVCCNACGYHTKALKPWQLRRKQKNLKRLEYEKKEMAINKKGAK